MVIFLGGTTGTATLGTGTLNAARQATLVANGLAIGSHLITARYGGDTKFGSSTSGPLTETINKAATTTTVVVSANPAVVGQGVTFTATVNVVAPGTGTPTGTVTFLDGQRTLGTGTLNAARQATLATGGLTVGSHAITAGYGGDATFSASTSKPLAETIAKAATAMTVTLSTNPAVVGQRVTFTATVNVAAPGAGTPTGTVTFYNDSSILSTGTLNGARQFTVATSGLTVGFHSITAVYGGDAAFAPSTSARLTETVLKADTTTTLTVSANPAAAGQQTTFTATVNLVAPAVGLPTGTVTFLDGTKVLGSGPLNGALQVTLTTIGLAVGPHSITARYGGDPKFLTSTSLPLTETVNKAATTTTIAASANPAVTGQEVTLTATVGVVAPGAGSPTGGVTFFDGTLLVGSGALNAARQVTLKISGLTVGPHTITARYAGDASFESSSAAPRTETVNKASTTTTVSVPANPTVAGRNVTLTATVSVMEPGAGTPTGTVVFRDGTTQLGTSSLNAARQAMFTTSQLGAGTRSITAQYAGSTNFASSTSGQLPLDVRVFPERAFVVNVQGGSVTVLDASHNQVIRTLPVGPYPQSLAVSPDGTKVYVLIPANGLIATIDTFDYNASMLAGAPHTANQLAVSPRGDRLYYVADGSRSGSLIMIDTTTHVVVYQLNLAGFARGLAVSPDGLKVLVANSNTVTVVDVGTIPALVERIIPVPQYPHSMAFSPDGSKAYVTSTGIASLSVIDMVHHSVSAPLPVGPQPYGVVVSRDGQKVYVANYAADTVSVVDALHNVIVATIPVGGGPWGVALNTDGTALYVTSLNGAVIIVSTMNNEIIGHLPVGQYPTEIAF